MIVHTMDFQAMWRDALEDWPAFERKLAPDLRDLQRLVIKDRRRSEKAVRMTCRSWESPRGNAWFMAVMVSKRTAYQYGLVHWNDRAGRLWAARVNQREFIVLTPHFMQRLYERQDDQQGARLRLWNLWQEMPDMRVRPLHYQREGQEVMGLITPHGLGLGVDLGQGVTVVKTYVDRSLLGVAQAGLLDAYYADSITRRTTTIGSLQRRVAQLEKELAQMPPESRSVAMDDLDIHFPVEP